MSQIIITEDAAEDMERCREFLSRQNPLAAEKAAPKII